MELRIQVQEKLENSLKITVKIWSYLLKVINLPKPLSKHSSSMKMLFAEYYSYFFRDIIN